MLLLEHLYLDDTILCALITTIFKLFTLRERSVFIYYILLLLLFCSKGIRPVKHSFIDRWDRIDIKDGGHRPWSRCG